MASYDNITMQPVSSSHVMAVGFDPLTNVLLIDFKNKQGAFTKRYICHGPSPEEFDQLLNAPSVGGYLKSVIEKKYQVTEV